MTRISKLFLASSAAGLALAAFSAPAMADGPVDVACQQNLDSYVDTTNDNAEGLTETFTCGAFSSVSDPALNFPVHAIAIGFSAHANSSDSMAIGIGAHTEANRATAIGEGAGAYGADSTALGYGAGGSAVSATAIGSQAIAFGDFSTVLGAGAQTMHDNSMALGAGATVLFAGGTAIGQGATVSEGNSVAIGQGSVADQQDTVSVGHAGGERRVTNVANGVDDHDAATMAQMNAGDAATLASANTYTDQQIATVAGGAAAAQQTADTALARTTYFAANGDGPASVASGANSVAIGPGASATRDGQVAIGGADATYTMAGIGSDASRAAQEGATRLVTTDMAGNLATLDLDVNALQGYGGRIDTLESRADAIDERLDAVDGRVDSLDGALQQGFRRANGGIAAAMALGGTVMPPDTHLAVSFNLATYRGEQGYSGAVVARVTDHVWVSGGYAGSTVRGSSGGRAGVTFGW